MSLDTLFQQILLTEQQLTEQTQKFKEVKVAIIRNNEKIKSATEKNEKVNEELDTKAQQLSAMRLQHDLMKKCEDQMLKQIEKLLGHQSQLRERLAKIKWESKEEKENFLQEISRFNKMELMSRRNSRMSSMQEEKRGLQLKRQGLYNVHKDLDHQLSEAVAMTESLKAESLFVSQKPLTDSTCLRLRKELEMHKEGELLREALSSEIHFLKSQKLDSSQGSEQH
ncbi:coiled-coil domain-containing protein 172 isoform X4 [Etheostoma spectabile]|uniref:coiled-coil domain-containing protein 172 isoform X4 n=1 Tax=Etheostoma spectabile TaxID=54343 RepID=UPI0013AF9F89|nr:coiled-coil domain-containing protein 172 isoform X4 [Etheostoma spectabile]